MRTAFTIKSITKREVKAFSSLLLVVLLTLPPLVDIFINMSHAADFTSYKVEIGDSRSGTATYHRFTFVTPSTTSIKTIDFQYCTTASGTCTAPSGMVLAASPTLGTVAGIGGTTYTASSTSGSCTGTGNTNCTLTLTVGTPGAQSAGGTVIVPFSTGITNPTTTNSTYFVRITSKDNGAATIDGPSAAAFAVLTSTSIAMTATVDPNFTFTVNGVSVAGNFNGGSGNINTTTTANTIPFGTIATGSARIAAHDLTVTTNAGSGYTITASHAANTQSGNPPLVSGTSNNIDAFSGTNASPSTWSSPAGTSANTNTGYFGYSTEDATLCTGTPNRFTNGGAKWAGSTTVGAEVACSTTGVSNETTRVGWEVEANNIQPAGAYTGTVILVATPTY